MTKRSDFIDPQLKWIKKYGNVVKYHELFNRPVLFVADPKIIQEITLKGDDHKRQRKMMNPAFTHSNIKEMIPTFIRVTSTLKGLIENEINQGKSSINLTPYISKTTLDIIGLVGFSYEFNSLTSPNELAQAYDSILNRPPKKMTDEELKYQIMTFLIAGHETTNITTCWALYSLSQHPHHQDKLREELVKAFPDKSNFNPTFDEINSLEFLNCVIKETLRISPPVPGIRRTNLKDEVFGEYFIPKNTEMIIGISALQKLPEIWGPTACEFDPNRWTDPTLIEKEFCFSTS
ncbi:unnamed protein product [Rhizophagus irregularis]|nr:unnamed protein product [Rhizophagus irregularis]